jgi:hypothetical protein
MGVVSTVELGRGVVVAAKVGSGVAFGVGLGVRAGVGVCVGEGVGVAFGVDVGNGVSVGDDDIRSCSVCVSGLEDSVGAGVGAGLSVDPGSSQLLTFSPLAKVACSLVFPCTRTTGPSNFPRTILPL